MEMHGFNNSIAYCEAFGVSLIYQAYAKFCPGEWVFQMGFNSNTGYVYIALENGISICSCLGNPVEYLVNNFENGEEIFYDSYEEALKNL